MMNVAMVMLMGGALATVGFGFPRLKRNLKCMATGRSLCQCRREGAGCV